MKKEDAFPNFGGRLDVKGLDFRIADAPASFTVRFVYSCIISCIQLFKF